MKETPTYAPQFEHNCCECGWTLHFERNSNRINICLNETCNQYMADVKAEIKRYWNSKWKTEHCLTCKYNTKNPESPLFYKDKFPAYCKFGNDWISKMNKKRCKKFFGGK